MRDAYTGSRTRSAERAAIEAATRAGDPDRYLRQAGRAMATTVLRHLGGAGLPAPDVAGPTPLRPSVAALAGSGVRGRRVVALIGAGNNGGDGLVALAELARRGAATTAVLLASRHHVAAATELRRAGGVILERDTAGARAAVAGAEIVVDAALGTGARGGMDLPEVPDAAWRVACDCPSGLDTDTGAADEHVPWADTTVTMGALKTGLILGRGRELSGDVVVVPLPGLLDAAELGAPELHVMTPAEALGEIAAPQPGDHKYSRGVLGLLAGSPAFPGAAVLCARAAVSAGLGMLSAFSRGSAATHLIDAVPEAVVTGRDDPPSLPAAKKVSAWLVGPGLGTEEEDTAAAVAVLGSAGRTGTPVLVDASGLQLLRRDAGSDGAPLLLTPHAGELSSLDERLGLELPSATEDPLAAVRAAASKLDCTVLLKGSTTLVATPEGTVTAACSAGPELAVAGSGDTLAGIAGALLATHSAQRTPDYQTIARLAAAAAVLHGLAGRRAKDTARPGAQGLAPALAEVIAQGRTG